MIIPVRPRLARALQVTILAVCAGSTARWLGHTLRAVAFPFPLDYGEGPLLDQAARLVAGESIYTPLRSAYPFTIANYPPVVPALLAGMRAAGLAGWAPARGLIVLACAACAVLVAQIACAGERFGRGGPVAVALFLSWPSVSVWSCFVRVDFIALALALASLFVAMRRPAARSTPWLCAALAAAAAFSRQSYLLAAPAAVSATLLMVDRRRAAVFAFALFAAVSATVIEMQFATRGWFWFHVVTANMNPWHGHLVRLAAMALVAAIGPLALALYGAIRLDRHDPVAIGTTTYFFAAAATSLLAAKDGASFNYFLELAAASSILVGRVCARVHRRGGGAAPVLDLCLAVQIVVLTVNRPAVLVAVDAKFADRPALDRVAAQMASEPSPVLADEMMGLLAAQGRRILYQPFELAELARQHVWDESAFVRDIRDRRFGLIAIGGQTLSDEAVRERWTKPMRDAIAQRYERDELLGGVMLWRPRATAP